MALIVYGQPTALTGCVDAIAHGVSRAVASHRV